MNYEAIVMGVSSGGMSAMKLMFPLFPENFQTPIIIVQHINARSDSQWIELLNKHCTMQIKEADEKETIEKGIIYIAPPNYHLMIEKNKTFSLSIDERVNFARPSIDVLFDTAAEAYKNKLIGVILTGANNDGTEGMKRIKQYGGLTIAQDPETAQSGYMPASAIASVKIDHVLPLEDIIKLLVKLTGNSIHK